ncbi:MAG: TonB-dependent receptor [Cyclobacteriaceae bacterium]
MKRIFVLLVIIGSCSQLFAQNGFLRGKIIDDELGEGLIGAAVYVEGTTNGSVTDWDGNYSISLEPGTYTIVISSVSYTTTKVQDVQIASEDVTSLDIRMKSDLQELEAVVVTAEVVRDSEMALLTIQKKSANVMDGISSQTFKKTGDSNLSGAIKRVTGVSVEGGKYVYVRGLGDRYTKTTLNGMDIPGLDPDRNSVQIDIFPTNVLDNVMVYKTFSPNLFGDFTGGIVNIDTKNFPEEKTTNFSIGISGTPGQTFNSNFILYDRGKFDFLGFDDGSRALPFDPQTNIPNEVRRDGELENLTRAFNPVMSATSRTALPNGSFSFAHGNQLDKAGLTFGYNVVLNYQNSTSFFKRTENNKFFKSIDYGTYNLAAEEDRFGPQGQNNVLWSSLISGAVKFDNHSFSVSLLRSQNGESNALSRTKKNFEQTGATLIENILTYTQRSVTNNIVSGKHNFDKFKLEWTNAINWSRVYDPDFRQTSVSITDGDTTLQVGDGAGINRFYRDLNEFNESFKVDATLPVGEKSKVKFGALGSYKQRDFTVNNYLFRMRGVSHVSTDADWFFQEENLWSPSSRTGTYVIGNFEAANTFEASQVVMSGYGMGELFLTTQLRTIFGLRAEQAFINYTGQNNTGSIVYDNEQTLNELNFLPSLNIVYNVSDNMNMRGSYNRTLARPSFREKSIAQIYDPISGRTFNGNLDLQQTDINNFDLRYEVFFSQGQMFSISGFYKTFDGHIELTSFATDPDQVKPRNSGNSTVFGTEIEVRRNLGFAGSALEKFSLGANVSLVQSRVDLRSVIVDNAGNNEYDLRQNNLREGEVVDVYRPMSGQAPYLINAFLNYRDEASDMNVNLSYNVQGETLFVIGSGRTPDVYTKSFHALNLNAYRHFGESLKHRLTFGVNNILNQARQNVYKSYQADEEIYSIVEPGMNISVKYNYKF